MTDVGYAFAQPVPVDGAYQVLKAAALATESKLQFKSGEVILFDPLMTRELDPLMTKEQRRNENPGGQFESISAYPDRLEFRLKSLSESDIGPTLIDRVVFPQFDSPEFDTGGGLGVYAKSLLTAMAAADKPNK